MNNAKMDIKPLDIDTIKVKAELCKRSLSYFVKEFWSEVVPNELIWNWHMDAVCEEVQYIYERVFLLKPKEHDLCINIPPGSSKTMLASVMATAWGFARKSSLRTAVGSYSDMAIGSIADNIRTVMRCKKYKSYFPEVVRRKDRDNLHNFKTVTNGEFYAFTIGGSLTSKHFDILNVDDPLDPRRAMSEAELFKANHFMSNTLPSRKTDKINTPTVLTMQRLSENDPSADMLKQPDCKHLCLPAELSRHVMPSYLKEKYVNGLLDPNRMPEEVLKGFKTRLGSYGYAGQFQQIPAPEDGGIWQKWFIPIKREDLPKLIDVGSDWDLAYTKEDKNSASAFVTSGRFGNDMYITNLGFKWLEFPDLINYMKSQQPTHYIEAKASGKSAKQSLSKLGINAVEISVNGGDKIGRTKLNTPFAEAGRVYVVDELLDTLYNDSNQGILKFPNNSHNDLNDALVQAIHRHFKPATKTKLKRSTLL